MDVNNPTQTPHPMISIVGGLIMRFIGMQAVEVVEWTMAYAAFPCELAAALIHYLEDTDEWAWVQFSYWLSVLNFFAFLVQKITKAYRRGLRMRLLGLVWTDERGNVAGAVIDYLEVWVGVLHILCVSVQGFNRQLLHFCGFNATLVAMLLSTCITFYRFITKLSSVLGMIDMPVEYFSPMTAQGQRMLTVMQIEGAHMILRVVDEED